MRGIDNINNKMNVKVIINLLFLKGYTFNKGSFRNVPI